MKYSGTRIVFAGALALLVLGSAGCGKKPENPTNRGVETPMETTDASVAAKRAKGVIELGDATYDLSLIICVGSTMATITASDKERRTEYPTVTVRIYDPAMTGGASRDTMSAYFERDGYAENWTLHTGSIERTDDIVSASGTLKGIRLVPNPDGTRKSIPMQQVDVLPFKARINCGR